jgi:hypothetical protein
MMTFSLNARADAQGPGRKPGASSYTRKRLFILCRRAVEEEEIQRGSSA